MRTTVLVGAGFSAALTMGAKPLIGHTSLPVLSNLGPELHRHLQAQRPYWASIYPMFPSEVIDCAFAGRIDPLELTLPPGPRERRDPVVRPLEPQFL